MSGGSSDRRSRLTDACALGAVLVPLQFDDRGECRVILTRRAEGGHRHAGQVALPGGLHEPGLDETLLDTALRELEEEVGVERAQVELLGALAERRTLSSNLRITPYVGRLPFPCRFRPCEREVARLFAVPIRELASALHRDWIEWTFEGRSWNVPCVRAGGEVIWGVTLQILEELLESGLVPPG